MTSKFNFNKIDLGDLLTPKANNNITTNFYNSSLIDIGNTFQNDISSDTIHILHNDLKYHYKGNDLSKLFLPRFQEHALSTPQYVNLIIPPWCTRIGVILIGAGGGGSGNGNYSTGGVGLTVRNGSPGGGGAYIAGIFSYQGKEVSYTIGKGGKSGDFDDINGKNGEDTIIKYDGKIMATAGGGKGGTAEITDESRSIARFYKGLGGISSNDGLIDVSMNNGSSPINETFGGENGFNNNSKHQSIEEKNNGIGGDAYYYRYSDDEFINSTSGIDGYVRFYYLI